nr:uncharacterized protein LOC122172910 [Chrysemys picta bellii]
MDECCSGIQASLPPAMLLRKSSRLLNSPCSSSSSLAQPQGTWTSSSPSVAQGDAEMGSLPASGAPDVLDLSSSEDGGGSDSGSDFEDTLRKGGKRGTRTPLSCTLTAKRPRKDASRDGDSLAERNPEPSNLFEVVRLAKSAMEVTTLSSSPWFHPPHVTALEYHWDSWEDFKAHQQLLRRVASNLQLQAEEMEEPSDTLFNVLTSSTPGRMALPLHQGVGQYYYWPLADPGIPGSYFQKGRAEFEPSLHEKDRKEFRLWLMKVRQQLKQRPGGLRCGGHGRSFSGCGGLYEKGVLAFALWTIG